MAPADCLFCKIANKEIPAKIVYEDENAAGILDVNPVSPGHSMILPKRHAGNILELPDEEIKGVFQAVKNLTAIIKNKLNPDGFTIGINHGRVSGQTVEHLHVHIIPRWENDGGGSIHSVVNNKPEKTLDEAWKEITN
jgi:histidine triad (HIT) family protein